MDYNGLYTSLLLLRLSDGEYIPLPSVQASYGPFASMDEAKADLISTFKTISNVPRGYTFCVIENDKPQEYWLTKAGNWSSREKKNVSSSSSTGSDLLIEARDGYLQVSYDDGDTWTPLVSLEALRGPAGDNGKDGTSDLSKVQIRMTSRDVTVPDPEDNEQTVTYTEYKLEYTINGGTNWINVGTIRSGSGGAGGSSNITIETYTDGNQYWKKDGNWMLDDHGNMVRANGKDGQDGADGAGFYTQFKSIIFKRSNNTRIVNGVELLVESEYPEGGTYNHPVPPSGEWYDGVPSGTAKLWMSTRWFSTNEAITEASTWSVPAPATDTADIDFEYSNAPINEIPNGPGPYKNINMYDASTNPNGWYDANEYPSLLENANWMTMRVCRNGIWGAWNTVKIRGEAGESPLVPVVEFTSVVFRRSNNTRTVDGKVKLAAAEYPQGGDYSSPVPTNRIDGVLLWTDGLPVGNEELLWMSTRIFRSDGNHGAWSEPIVATDGSNGWDFEWHDSETPTTPYPTRQSPDDANPQKTNPNDGWYDEASQNSDPIWMAIRPYEGNVYTSPNWTVMRVKGERGTDGTSFVPKGQLFGIFDTQELALSYYQSHATTLGTQKYAIVGVGMNLLYEYSATYPTGNRVNGISIGDAYVNSGGAGKFDKTAGDLKEHVFIWDGDNFVDFGNIQGPKGDTMYFHVKYSNDGGHSFTYSGDQQDGETPGDYIGTRVDSVAADSMNPNDYKWSKFKGEDGFGYEYIFKLTADETAPHVPTTNECIDYVVWPGTQDERTVTYQDDDYVPGFLGWTDDPGSPTKALPYCWVAYRRKIDGQWQPYRGGSADSARAALFSVYSSNGRGIDHIAEMYAIGASGTEAPDLNDFGQSIPPFDFVHNLIYLWNYEVIYYDDNTTQTTDPECIAVSEKGRGIETIQEFYYACSFGDNTATDLQTHLPQWGGPNRSSAWKSSPMNVDKNNPFLWNFELITYTDGTSYWTDPVIIAYYVYTDVEYLMKIFKKVEGNENTAYLGGLIGAIDQNQKIQAMLNATDIGKDDEHGKLYIAAGMNGLDGTDVQKNQKAQNATFKVYEDGHVSMRSAELQGYLTQHFRRVHDVSRYIADVGNGTQTRFLDKSKLSNALLLGWNTLSFSEDGNTVDFENNYQVNLATFLDSDNAGRVILSNQLYVSKNGAVFSNNNFGKTLLKGYFILPNGTITSGSSGVALYGGWVEVIKVSSLNADMQLIVPQLSSMDNLYIVTGYGGSVRFTYVDTLPNINENQAVVTNAAVGFNVDYSRRSTVLASGSESILRLTEFNRTVLVGGDSDDDTLYIIIPKLYVDTWYDQQVADIQYKVFFTENHRRVVFKVEIPGSDTPDAEVEYLPDLTTIAGGSFVISANTEGGTLTYRYGVRLSYIAASGGTLTGDWLAEEITPIASL